MKKNFSKILAVVLAMVMLISLIPLTASAETQNSEMSEEFKSILSDGKYVINCIKPNKADDSIIHAINWDIYTKTHNGMNISMFSISDDFSKVTIELNIAPGEFETHTVDIVWNYDEEILQSAESIQGLPENDSDEKYFYLSDLEFMNYLAINGSIAPGNEEMADYCREFKEITKNTDFSLKMITQAGEDNAFFNIRLGSTRLYHQDTLYRAWTSSVLVKSNHIIYIPESTADTKEALMLAAQKRVDDYIGENVITITDSGMTVSQYYENEIAQYDKQISELQQQLPALESSWEIMDCENKIEYLNEWKDTVLYDYNNGDYRYEFLHEAVGDYMFFVTVNSTDELYNFIVVKDDSKLDIPLTNQGEGDVEIIAPEKPGFNFDVDNIESTGDRFIIIKENIVDNLGEDWELLKAFDITLKNKDGVHVQPDGTVKVKLPLDWEKEGNYKVFRVNDDGTLTDMYAVREGSHMVFETDHFSVYVIVEENPEEQSKDFLEFFIRIIKTFISIIKKIVSVINSMF